MATSPTVLASQDGQRRRISTERSGCTVITRVSTRNTGATMLAVDRSPIAMITSAATIRTPKNGGLPASPGPGVGSGLGGVLGAGAGVCSGTGLLGRAGYTPAGPGRARAPAGGLRN